MKRSRAAAPLCLLFAACGTSSISRAQAGAQLAGAACARMSACCAGDESALSTSACVADFAPVLQAGLSADTTDVLYDGNAAAGCVADLNAASCDQVLIDLASIYATSTDCNGILVGTLVLGAPCTQGVECLSTLCTNIDPTSLQGTCAAPGDTDLACASASSGDSTDGAVCALGTFEEESGSSCTCAPVLANGGGCSSADQCQSGYCNSQGACAPVPSSATLDSATCDDFYNSVVPQ